LHRAQAAGDGGQDNKKLEEDLMHNPDSVTPPPGALTRALQARKAVDG